MNIITFDTDNAVFQFDPKDAEKCLEKIILKHGVDEAKAILRGLVKSRDVQLLKVQSDYFGYVALELIGGGKGSVTCKSCDQEFLYEDLKSEAIGSGKSPFNQIMKRKRCPIDIFKREQMLQGMMVGGIKYKCPNDHDLISMITWRV
jgi:hypothetical protein